MLTRRRFLSSVSAVEPNECRNDIEAVEIFRLASRGGLEIHYRDSPIVTLKTNGAWGYDAGVPFESDGLRRLAEYLIRYADRLDEKHPSHAGAKRDKSPPIPV